MFEDRDTQEEFFHFTLKDLENLVATVGAGAVAEGLSKQTAAALLDALGRRFYHV
jgi:hypothetical protein